MMEEQVCTTARCSHYADHIQIVSAVQIAWDPRADQNLKGQAFDFVNQLRAEPSAWQPCLSIFTNLPRHPEVVRVYCLEIVNQALQGGFVNEGGMQSVKEELMAYLRDAYKGGGLDRPRDSSMIENKIAQTVTYLFTALYASGWETIFQDLLGLSSSGDASQHDLPEGTMIYLRVVNSVHDEIGDQSLSRSRAEQDRANLLKDLMRQRDIVKIASAWREMLTQWASTNDIIAEAVLRAISKYVSWIDISLIVNQQMLELLFQQLERAQKVGLDPDQEVCRDAAIDVFTEITGKKMKISDKVDMINFLNLNGVASQLIAGPLLTERRFSSQYDTDLAETVAKLVNVTVVDVTRALESEPQSSETWQKAENILQAFLPHLLRFFSDEYDEVCSTVIPGLNDVLSYLRKSAKDGPPSPQRAVMLLPILKAIFAKMRYDDTCSSEDEDEQTDEAEFLDLRKRLDSLQQIIAAADEQLYMDALTALVNETFTNLSKQGLQLNWRDLELALHQMYLFGDLAIKTGGLYNKNKPNSPAAERLVQMMQRMVESGMARYLRTLFNIETDHSLDIRSFIHSATQLQYMEICVRYSTFFDKHTQYITTVLQNFLQLVHHPAVKVKTRSWYLFQRLVRLLRSHVGGIADSIVHSVNDLLPIHAEVPMEADEDESEDFPTSSAEAIFSSQLYLFEAVGCVCGAKSVPADQQARYAESVMQPVFADMQHSLLAARASDQRAILQIHHDIMALGTLARGFSDWVPGSSAVGNAPAEQVQTAFSQVAEATLVALESLKTSFNVRTAARFAFSRLVGVLGARILPQLPRWINGLLTASSSKDEVALFLRLLDQVIFGFKNDISSFLDTLFTGLLQRVFTGLADTPTGTDDEIQLAELKREYLNFLLVILNNDLGSVIVSTTNQPFFDTLIRTIEHFTKDGEDFPTAKMAFQVLGKMCSTWGGPDVVATPGQVNGVSPAPQPALPGLDRFMISRFSPLCWALPATPSFNAKDAQARQVLAEAANLQKVIYAKTGQDYLTYLRTDELRNTGMNDEMINDYLNKLTGLDAKGFRGFFQAFVGRAGGS